MSQFASKGPEYYPKNVQSVRSPWGLRFWAADSWTWADNKILLAAMQTESIICALCHIAIIGVKYKLHHQMGCLRFV